MKKPLALFQGFHFILLLHSTWKVPSSALHSAYLLPSHKISISTPSPRFLLYSLLKWRLQREQNGSRVAQMRRQSQDMSWGHLWCSTWTWAEVVPGEHRGLLGAQGGGREPLMSPPLTVLLWPSPTETHPGLRFFNSSLAYESLKRKWVISESNWRWIQFLQKETEGGFLDH